MRVSPSRTSSAGPGGSTAGPGPDARRLAPAPGRRWLAAVLLLSLGLDTVGLGWGIAGEGEGWAADGLTPVAALATVKRAWVDEPRGSGWFPAKYPLGHFAVVAAVQAPYVAAVWLTGDLGAPSSDYPYGFRRPHVALRALALLARCVSVLMGVALVGLAFAIGTALFGAAAGLAGAVLVAGSYPLVFYAHTANVDVPMLFWAVLAVAAALRSADHDSTPAALLAGLAAGMALYTKEQSLGILGAIPVIWLIRRAAARGVSGWAAVGRHAALAGTGFAAVTVVVGNLWRNPAGFVNRWRFLLGVLPGEIRARYVSYQFYVSPPAPRPLGDETAHLAHVAGLTAEALTLPVLLACLAGLGYALVRRPGAAAVPGVVLLGYYVVSLRALPEPPVRHVVPLLYFLLVLGGAAGGVLIEAARRSRPVMRRRLAGAAVAVGCVFALLPGIEVDRLLLDDPRHAAEAWLREHAPPGSRVEVYQPATYLPRFPSRLRVVTVPLEDRTRAAFEQRRPDLVVVSSAAPLGLTGARVRDWRPGSPIMGRSEEARVFFEALRSDALGYREVVRFTTVPRWITPRITSLNPEIAVFGAAGPSPGRPASGPIRP